MQVSTNDEYAIAHVPDEADKGSGGADDVGSEDEMDIQSSTARFKNLSLESPIVAAMEPSGDDVRAKLGDTASQEPSPFSSSGSEHPSDDDSSSESDGEDCMPNNGHDLIDDSDGEEEAGLESHGTYLHEDMPLIADSLFYRRSKDNSTGRS